LVLLSNQQRCGGRANELMAVFEQLGCANGKSTISVKLYSKDVVLPFIPASLVNPVGSSKGPRKVETEGRECTETCAKNRPQDAYRQAPQKDKFSFIGCHQETDSNASRK